MTARQSFAVLSVLASTLLVVAPAYSQPAPGRGPFGNPGNAHDLRTGPFNGGGTGNGPATPGTTTGGPQSGPFTPGGNGPAGPYTPGTIPTSDQPTTSGPFSRTNEEKAGGGGFWNGVKKWWGKATNGLNTVFQFIYTITMLKNLFGYFGSMFPTNASVTTPLPTNGAGANVMRNAPTATNNVSAPTVVHRSTGGIGFVTTPENRVIVAPARGAGTDRSNAFLNR